MTIFNILSQLYKKAEKCPGLNQGVAKPISIYSGREDLGDTQPSVGCVWREEERMG